MMPPPTWYSAARVTSPSSTRAALAVVPPMSRVMIRGSPLRRSQRLGADHARGRSRFHDVHRALDRRSYGHKPTVGLHEQQRARAPVASRWRCWSERRYRRTTG